MAVHGIIVAAGSSTRTGSAGPKQLADLDGRPLVVWSVDTFLTAGVSSLVVVAADRHLAATAEAVRAVAPTATVVTGGRTRSDSVRRGLDAIVAAEDEIVLIHDAARPLVSCDLVASVIDAVKLTGAATPVVSATDTLIEADGTTAGAAIDRTNVRLVQTPQGFRMGVIVRAHGLAEEVGDTDATDDAGLVSRHLGVAVTLVEGDDTNLKITTPSDFIIAEALARAGQVSEQTEHRRVDST